jgi:hypothetical protein
MAALGQKTEPPKVQAAGWIPQTEAERAAIREQLSRLLASPEFINSKRCASLLRFVVASALEGNVEHLKERTLGIDVFQREPDYDTNRDPVVRNTAVEIRKRLAHYYSIAERAYEIRIGFPVGSYIPEFRIPAEWTLPRPVEPSTEQPLSKGVSPVRRWVLLGAAALAVAVVIAGAIAVRKAPARTTALERFWAPVFVSSDPVLLLIGSAERASQPSAVSVSELQNQQRVHFADAATLSRIAGVMVKRGKPYHIRLEQAAALEDLRDGPVVLIGAFDNDWTLRLTDHVRYAFVRDDASHMAWITDRQNPSDRKWSMRWRDPYREVKEDYALVSRVLDPITRRIVVTAAGISKFGTAAAGEFLSEPGYMEEAMGSAPKGWERKNVQIVLATSLVKESSGPPRVIATYFW